jgi:hypothetical protein
VQRRYVFEEISRVQSKDDQGGHILEEPQAIEVPPLPAEYYSDKYQPKEELPNDRDVSQ